MIKQLKALLFFEITPSRVLGEKKCDESMLFQLDMIWK